MHAQVYGSDELANVKATVLSKDLKLQMSVFFIKLPSPFFTPSVFEIFCLLRQAFLFKYLFNRLMVDKNLSL